MSAVGVVAAASCISTGVFALTSDVLPFSGWSGDKDRADGRLLLPAGAPVTRLASARPSELTPLGVAAPAIFMPAVAGAGIVPAASGAAVAAVAEGVARPA